MVDISVDVAAFSGVAGLGGDGYDFDIVALRGITSEGLVLIQTNQDDDFPQTVNHWSVILATPPSGGDTDIEQRTVAIVNIPDKAFISAKLRFLVNQWIPSSGSPLTVSLYKLATIPIFGQVTWNCRQRAVPWDTPGGDLGDLLYSSEVSGEDEYVSLFFTDYANTCKGGKAYMLLCMELTGQEQWMSGQAFDTFGTPGISFDYTGPM